MDHPDQILMLPLWYVVFLLSLTCHEGAHAWAAWRGGDPTAYLGGQVSLNPLPHVQREMFGTVLFPLLSYFFVGWMMGWASAPYDPNWEERYPRRAAVMAAAGPLANLLLAVIAFVVLKVGLGAGWWTPPLTGGFALDRLVLAPAEGPQWLEGLGRFCSILLSLNLVLCLFNLMPLPPMDGASIVAGLSTRARELRNRLQAQPMAGLLGLVIAWTVFRWLFGPIFVPVVRLLWN